MDRGVRHCLSALIRAFAPDASFISPISIDSSTHFYSLLLSFHYQHSIVRHVEKYMYSLIDPGVLLYRWSTDEQVSPHRLLERFFLYREKGISIFVLYLFKFNVKWFLLHAKCSKTLKRGSILMLVRGDTIIASGCP